MARRKEQTVKCGGEDTMHDVRKGRHGKRNKND